MQGIHIVLLDAYYQEASVETNEVECVCGGNNKPFSFNKFKRFFYDKV